LIRIKCRLNWFGSSSWIDHVYFPKIGSLQINKYNQKISFKKIKNNHRIFIFCVWWKPKNHLFRVNLTYIFKFLCILSIESNFVKLYDCDQTSTCQAKISPAINRIHVKNIKKKNIKIKKLESQLYVHQKKCNLFCRVVVARRN
jgi:hypothetical protein